MSALSTVIATRKLFRADDSAIIVVAEVFAPYFDESRNSWSCEFKLSNAPPGLAQMTMGGSDSYQALKIALETLKTHIEILNERHMDNQLRYLDFSDPDLHL